MDNAIIDIISKVLKIDTSLVVESLTMETCKMWDSLKHMELVSAIEESTEILFSAEEIVSMTSIGKIFDVIESKRNH